MARKFRAPSEKQVELAEAEVAALAETIMKRDGISVAEFKASHWAEIYKTLTRK